MNKLLAFVFTICVGIFHISIVKASYVHINKDNFKESFANVILDHTTPDYKRNLTSLLQENEDSISMQDYVFSLSPLVAEFLETFPKDQSIIFGKGKVDLGVKQDKIFRKTFLDTLIGNVDFANNDEQLQINITKMLRNLAEASVNGNPRKMNDLKEKLK